MTPEPATFEAAIALFKQRFREYEASRECLGADTIDIPKLYIADHILRMLDIPTFPSPYWLVTKEPESSRQQERRSISATLRWTVFKRDNYRCVDCNADTDLTVDHIHPQSQGGEHTSDNLQTLCRSCNSRKGDRLVFDIV